MIQISLNHLFRFWKCGGNEQSMEFYYYKINYCLTNEIWLYMVNEVTLTLILRSFAVFFSSTPNACPVSELVKLPVWSDRAGLFLRLWGWNCLWNVTWRTSEMFPKPKCLWYHTQAFYSIIFKVPFISVSCSPTVLFMTYLLNNGQKKVYFLSFRCFICGRAVNTVRFIKSVDDNSVCLILHV